MSKPKYNDLSIIVAVDETGGYAKDKTIPWSFKEDWKHFQAVTKNNICLMGRGTYEDIAARRAARSTGNQVTTLPDEILPTRTSYVVSRTLTEARGAIVVPSIQTMLDQLPDDEKREIWILGGRRLFVECLTQAKQVWMTIVPGSYDTNKKFPVSTLNRLYTIVEGREESGLKFVRYVRKVTYYTIKPHRRIPHQQLVDYFSMTNRYVKTTENGAVVIVRPRDGELDSLPHTQREGLAVE